jgi:hypothetical protein
MACALSSQPPTPDDLWRDFRKTDTEFEARFASEEDCRAYWIEARWGGTQRARSVARRGCGRYAAAGCSSAECGHQTSLTSGTGADAQPLKMWFLAVFEISRRRTGISAKDLPRRGYGSAWGGADRRPRSPSR